MPKMIRAVMALALLALCSAMFAGSADVYVGSGSIDINISGTGDGSIAIYNLDTNQSVASVSALLMYGPGSSYYYSGSGHISGVSVTSNGYTSGTVSGLPPGNYRVTAESWQMYDFSSYSTGSYAEVALWGYYGAWMDFYFNGY
jgi:hypothetical protein